MNITLAPHLQQALDALSKDLRLDPQAVLDQAVFAWLRSNGYAAPPLALPVVPKSSETQRPAPVLDAVEAPPPSAPVMTSTATPAPVPSVPEAINASPVPQPAPIEPEAPAPVEVPEPQPVAEVPAPELTPPEPNPIPVAASNDGVIARMKEIDADLQALTRPWPDWVVPLEAPEEDEPDEPQVAAEPSVVVKMPSEESMPGDDEKTILPGAMQALQMDEPGDEGSTIVLKSAPIALFLEREGEPAVKVEVERFIIGRGPQCDMVIDSPRVSREHLAITRQGLRYFAKDLNSSNGTWMGEDRVTEREIESGDTLHLGNEPVTFSLRALA